VKYLQIVGHPKWNDIDAAKIEKIKLPWATKNNDTDCGVFVMRHMEMFMGNYGRNWECGFGKDERTTKTKITTLRKRYAVRIMTSDVNIHKDKVLKEAEELHKAKKK
jgi:Ulp1 family protease